MYEKPPTRRILTNTWICPQSSETALSRGLLEYMKVRQTFSFVLTFENFSRGFSGPIAATVNHVDAEDCLYKESRNSECMPNLSTYGELWSWMAQK